jgi:PPP family 3-phenylpropionic acid transporter
VTQVRIALYYAAFYGANGVFLPFWPVWLLSRGLNAVDIGIIFACTSAARVVTAPLVAQIADRRGDRKPLIVIFAAISALLYLLYPVSQDFAILLVVSIFASATWFAGSPLGESLTIIAASREGFEYARVRLWGSIAFIAIAVGAGHLLEGRDANTIYVVGLVVVIVMFASTLGLPNPKVEASTSSAFPLLEVLRQPSFLLFLAAAGCVQSSHGVYYAFATIHWRSAGLDDALIGLLWAEGVIAEIVLFAFAVSVLRKLEPEKLILLGGLAGLVRWSILASTDWLPVLIIVQVLHAFTFGAAHLGAIHFMARAIPAQLSATAQSVYAAAVMGIASGGSMFLSGWLYGQVGGKAYVAMAALGAAGALGAAALPKAAVTEPISGR